MFSIKIKSEQFIICSQPIILQKKLLYYLEFTTKKYFSKIHISFCNNFTKIFFDIQL
jgi:hypothetical protein